MNLFARECKSKLWFLNFIHNCSVHIIFRFWVLVTVRMVTNLQKYENIKYLIFIYILQGKMGKTGKNEKNISTKVNKIPKDENMG